MCRLKRNLYINHIYWRPQTFFQGVQNFPVGGAKTLYLPKKHLKTYYFRVKKSKNTLLCPAGGGGGQGPPLKARVICIVI